MKKLLMLARFCLVLSFGVFIQPSCALITFEDSNNRDRFERCQALAFLATEATYQSCRDDGGSAAACDSLRAGAAGLIIQCQGASR